MQILANSLVSGVAIALLAVGFSAVYLPTRVFHIALGGIYAIAPFFVWVSLQPGIPWLWIPGIAVALTAGIIISLLCEVLNHAPLERKKVSPMAHLVSSLGQYIVLVAVIVLIWGNATKALRTGLDVSFALGRVDLTGAQLVTAIAGLSALSFYYIWLGRSKLGLQFRALADNPIELALKGYNIGLLRILAFGISGLLCSFAGILAAYDVQFNPNIGFNAILVAVVAMIIGGRHSFYGALLGGIALGVIRHASVWFLGARWEDAVTFALLALFLILLPNGILGKRFRLEAET